MNFTSLLYKLTIKYSTTKEGRQSVNGPARPGPRASSPGGSTSRPSGAAAMQVAQQRTGGPGGEAAAQPGAKQPAAGKPTAHARRDEQAGPARQWPHKAGQQCGRPSQAGSGGIFRLGPRAFSK